jgi:DNA gyrase inhibitor GyrI/AraC-like DNA-binding protein
VSVYTLRIDRVLDYIAENLDGDLSLAKLARVACFSAFHFHRIFHSLTGETLNNHVRRIRLERAAALMKASPEARITDIALDAGFVGLAEFSRAFKNHFGFNASAWDRKKALPNSKNCKAPEPFPPYPEHVLDAWSKQERLEVKLTRFPACRFVYIRVHNPYGNQRLVEAYHQLMRWLAAQQVNVRDVVVIGMSQDDPAITPHEKCRYDLGVAFPSDAANAGLSGTDLLAEVVRQRGGSLRKAPAETEEFSARQFRAGHLAAFRCQGDLAQVDRAWQYLYRCWLPSSRYEPAELPAMEVFVRLPEEIGWETFDLYACIPVRQFA